MKHTTMLDTPEGRFGAYVATTATVPAPLIIVIQEIFGVNADMRAQCDALAADGYIAVCPDLFWRLEPGVELSDRSEAEWKRAVELHQAFDIDQGVRDIAASIALARHWPGSTGKVGVMGFCMGGRLTFLSAVRNHPDAAVAYYGGRTEQHLAELDALTTPLMLHLGEADEFISAQARAAIIDAVRDHPEVIVHTYPGQKHAFARVDGINYNARAATLARERTAAFFAEHLR